MRYWKSIMALGLSASMLSQLAIPVYAQTNKPDGYDDQRWEQIIDNRLEYDEIEDRVVNFSSSYLSVEYETSKLYAPYEEAVNSLEGSIEDSKSALKDAKELGDQADIIEKNILLKTEQGTKKAYETVIKRYKGSTDRVLNTTVKGSLVMASEGLMISYYRLVSALEMMDANITMLQSTYDSVIVQQSLGMATANDILMAQDQLLTAKVQQQTTKNQLDQVKHNLCLLLGWEYDADIEFGAIPEPDQNRISQMNLESDIQKAIGNNYTLSDLRHSSASGVSAKQNRLKQMEDMEAQITTGVNLSHSEVLKAQAAYDAASSAYESARLNHDAAGRQYQLGILSPLQYQQMTVGYMVEKMNYDNAKLDFFQAMENYDWAIKGNLSLE